MFEREEFSIDTQSTLSFKKHKIFVFDKKKHRIQP